MAWGETGTGIDLVLDYSAMCNNLCKCNGQGFHCSSSKKIQYKEGRCRNACDQWFGNTMDSALCKGYCYILGQGSESQLPVSKPDYLNRFVTSNNPKIFYKSPINGKIPGENISWTEWRDSVFINNVGADCNKAGSGNYVAVNNNPLAANYGQAITLQGQTLAANFYDENILCNKYTGFYSKYFDGIWYNKLQPVRLRHLYSFSNPYRPPLIHNFDHAKIFCENLLYANGQPVPAAERPFACGGTGSNFSGYNPALAAYNSLQPEISEAQNQLTQKMNNAIKITQASWGIALLLILLLLLFRFL